MAIDIICRCGHDAALHETSNQGGGCSACPCMASFGQAVISELLQAGEHSRKERDTRRHRRLRYL